MFARIISFLSHKSFSLRSKVSLKEFELAEKINVAGVRVMRVTRLGYLILINQVSFRYCGEIPSQMYTFI